MAQKATSEFLKRLLQQENESHFISEAVELDDIDHILLDHYQAFVENHSDIIFILSLEGDIVTQNNDIFTCLGYPSEHHKNYKEIMSESHYKKMKQAFTKAKKGEMSEETIELVQSDGKPAYFHITFFTIKSTTDLFAGIYVVAQNKTKEITLQKDLTNINEFYETIFNHLDVGIWARNYQDDELTFASKGLGKIMNVSISDIYDGRFAWDEMIPEKFHQLLSDNSKLIHKSKRIKQTYQINLTNGKTK